MFEVRYVSPNDKAFWFTLDSHMSKSEFDLKVRDRRGYTITDENKPVGIMRYNLFWDNIPFLTLIFFKKHCRGKGLGRQSLLFWENEMRELGFSMVMTSTQANEDAQHFYRKLGYKEMGCLILNNTPYEQPLEIFFGKELCEGNY
jgi:ribosomal protein S18 acetylase RimI-like enzyme